MFCDKPTLYEVPESLKGKRDYFRSHTAGEWVNNEADRNTYREIYGQSALTRALNSGLVCENYDGAAVGGPGYKLQLGVTVWDVWIKPAVATDIQAPSDPQLDRIESGLLVNRKLLTEIKTLVQGLADQTP